VLNRGNNMVEKLPAVRKLLLDNNNLVTVPATWNEKLFNGRIITSFPSIN
jgi:hypothetical protein